MLIVRLLRIAFWAFSATIAVNQDLTTLQGRIIATLALVSLRAIK